MDGSENSGRSRGASLRRTAVTVEEARRAIMGRVGRAEAVEVELAASIGRRLAADVTADAPIPHFRRSGMDGFAVRFGDIERAAPHAPVELEVVERIPCGRPPARTIASGEAARIMTGGMVPDGADAVIMLELAEETMRDGRACVRIRKTDARGAHIARIGEEAGSGDSLLRAGQAIGAGEAAVLAAAGCSRVRVYRKPKVAILSTGSELLPVAEPLRPAKIRNSNAYMLAAQIVSAGGEPLLAGRVPDDGAQAERHIADLLSSDADLVVATGGVSVGDYDIMADFFRTWEGTTLFNKVAMRPGSPTSAGIRRDKFVFGLSGNPSACFAGFELFVRPVLLGMQGAAETRTFGARLTADYNKTSGYTRYVQGHWRCRGGRVEVEPVGPDKSSAVLSIKDVNGLIVVPPGGSGIRAGEIVQVVPAGGAGFP